MIALLPVVLAVLALASAPYIVWLRQNARERHEQHLAALEDLAERISPPQ